MKLKPAHVLALCALGGATMMLSPLATAKNAYRLQAQEQYKWVDKDGKAAPAITCTMCHIAPNGGRSWNKFGSAMSAIYFGEAKRNVGDMLYLTLKAGKDADADGYTDVLEIVAKTLPGDAKSKPTASVKDLEAELVKLGGVDAFKPVTK
jgi:hypothetical protein